MLQAFKHYINRHQLFATHRPLLLAVSAGIDSVVLCHLMHQAGWPAAVAHVNFGLRGQASHDNANFVQQLAQRLGFPFFLTQFNVTVQRRAQESTQMAARRLRYAWFKELVQQEGFQAVATGHHADDALETLLLNLTRGTGYQGVAGMLPRQGHLVRPLLFATRTQIQQFAQEYGIAWQEDATNQTDAYVRNRLRHNVAPALWQQSPQQGKSWPQSLERLQGSVALLNHYVQQLWQQYTHQQEGHTVINLQALQAALARPQASPVAAHADPLAAALTAAPADPQKDGTAPTQAPYAMLATLLFEWLKPYHFSYKQVQQVLLQPNTASGQTYQAGPEQAPYTLRRNRHELWLQTQPPPPLPTITINSANIQYLPDAPATPLPPGPFGQLEARVLPIKGYKIDPSPQLAALDYDTLALPLQVRPWQKADRFQPLGMRSQKKVSDFMIDAKIPINLKNTQYVVTTNNRIAWLLGLRIDQRFCISPHTKRVLQLRLLAPQA